MYEELIEELRTTERICRDRMDGEVMLRAADAIEELQSVVEHYAEVFVTEIPRWISVRERLPKEYAEVLVFTITGNVVLDRLESMVADYIPDFRKLGVGAVTHWMPLPEPPKEETE